MRARLEHGTQSDRADSRRRKNERRPYETPRMREFDEDLRRRCAQVHEELGHLLQCLVCEDPNQPAQVEKTPTGPNRFDPHYWG